MLLHSIFTFCLMGAIATNALPHAVGVNDGHPLAKSLAVGELVESRAINLPVPSSDSWSAGGGEYDDEGGEEPDMAEMEMEGLCAVNIENDDNMTNDHTLLCRRVELEIDAGGGSSGSSSSSGGRSSSSSSSGSSRTSSSSSSEGEEGEGEEEGSSGSSGSKSTGSTGTSGSTGSKGTTGTSGTSNSNGANSGSDSDSDSGSDTGTTVTGSDGKTTVRSASATGTSAAASAASAATTTRRTNSTSSALPVLVLGLDHGLPGIAVVVICTLASAGFATLL